ncbi:serine/threonine-protein kinase [Zhihengliuella halotolerans]|uniref:serine/threonine-protein kinase n=1 Tax=Zhihengliuella halotolerans TaxID=370736 RepID=UPI000C7F9B6D|nr:serine/threonine-protein kinase [Zhihengliuella halotolerans]
MARNEQIQSTTAEAAGRAGGLREDSENANVSDALRGGESVEILRTVGAGATGTVYEVRRAGRVGTYALKVLADAENGLQLRRREAEALQALRHDHLVELHGWATAESGPGLLMEFLPQGSADQLIARHGPMAPGEAVTLVAPIASALAYLHEQGAAHGDVGPSNVLFTAEGRPKLSDLGVSSLLGGRGSMARPPGFSAPELETERSGSDERPADVYALGALTCFALTGTEPGRRPLPEMPAEAADLLERSLDSEPDRRPSAEDFWVGIFAAGEPQPLDLTGPAPRTDASRDDAPAAAPAPVPTRPARRRPARRSPAGASARPVGLARHWRSVAVAGVVVLAACGLIWAAASGVLTTDDDAGAGESPGPTAASGNTDPPAAAAPEGVGGVVQALAERRSEALTTLNPELLDEVYASPEAAAGDLEVIDELVAQGRRYDDLSISMSDAEVLEEAADSQRVRVTSRILPYSVLDASGARVETVPDAEAQALELELAETGEGWRIASIESAEDR